MKISKSFRFEKGRLKSIGEFDEIKGLINENKHQDIKIKKENELETTLLRNTKEVMMYAGKIFHLLNPSTDDFVAWHIFNWEEAKNMGLTEETIFGLMGKQLSEEIK